MNKKMVKFLYEDKTLRIIMPKIKSYITTVDKDAKFNILFSYKNEVLALAWMQGSAFIKLYDEIIQFKSFTSISSSFYDRLQYYALPLVYYNVSGRSSCVNWKHDIDQITDIKVIGSLIWSPALSQTSAQEERLLAMFNPAVNPGNSAYHAFLAIDNVAGRPDGDKKVSAAVDLISWSRISNLFHILAAGGPSSRIINPPLTCLNIYLADQDPEIKGSGNAGAIKSFLSSIESTFPLQYVLVLDKS